MRIHWCREDLYVISTKEMVKKKIWYVSKCGLNMYVVLLQKNVAHNPCNIKYMYKVFAHNELITRFSTSEHR